jgi:hypothetical protein
VVGSPCSGRSRRGAGGMVTPLVPTAMLLEKK